jgi:hypothetical protein
VAKLLAFTGTRIATPIRQSASPLTRFIRVYVIVVMSLVILAAINGVLALLL